MLFDLHHLLLLVAFVPAGVIAQGFFSSCTDCSMSDEEFLCSCRDNGGQYVSTSQDLNICLANRGGSLVASYDGGAFATCAETSYNEANGWFGCQCENGHGGWQTATYQLNNIIGNDNGALFCNI